MPIRTFGAAEILEGIFDEIHAKLFADNVTAIIPAYNEADTISRVVESVSKAKVDEVIVVDDGSRDKTADNARAAGARVISHRKNRGKGVAMKTGLDAAKGNVVVFIDGDLRSLSNKKVNALLSPILRDEADFVKSYFSGYKSKTGTSAFLYKPLLKHLFSAQSFTHPVSGQIAGRKRFFKSIEFRNDYGIDISILIDAVERGLRIKEVCLGKLAHRKRSPEEVMKIADCIIETILEKAGIMKKL